MKIETEEVPESLPYRCSRCGIRMRLPEWVSMEADVEEVVFQCSTCNREATLDIGNYPKTRVRVVVNEWHDSINAQGVR